MREARSTLELPPGLQHMRGAVDALHVAASKSSSSREPVIPHAISDFHQTFAEESERIWTALRDAQQRVDRMEKQMLEYEKELKDLRIPRASEQESAAASTRVSTYAQMYAIGQGALDESLKRDDQFEFESHPLLAALVSLLNWRVPC